MKIVIIIIYFTLLCCKTYAEETISDLPLFYANESEDIQLYDDTLVTKKYIPKRNKRRSKAIRRLLKNINAYSEFEQLEAEQLSVKKRRTKKKR